MAPTNGDHGKAHYSGDVAALIDIELQRLAGKPAQQPTIYCGLLTLVVSDCQLPRTAKRVLSYWRLKERC